MSTDLKKLGRRSPKRFIILLIVILAIILGIIAIKSYTDLKGDLHNQQVKNQTITTQIQNLNQELDKAKKDDKDHSAQSQQQIEQLEQQKKDLESQLQAKADEKSRLAQVASSVVNTVTGTTSAYAAPVASIAGCGDNSYANYIYMHESGCRTSNPNSEGCDGLGQACPASKLWAACPDRSYDCQNAFFTSYAVGRYGSWEGAYNFWLANHWW